MAQHLKKGYYFYTLFGGVQVGFSYGGAIRGAFAIAMWGSELPGGVGF